jgi:hypothetical protein
MTVPREALLRARANFRAGSPSEAAAALREAPDDADARAALKLLDAGLPDYAEAVLADAVRRRRAAERGAP